MPALQDDWGQHLQQSLHLQHGRVREFLAAQSERWHKAEAGLRQQIEQLTGEARLLRERCEQLQRELAEREPTPSAGDDSAMEDLRRRYEMSLEDLRELKARNAELQKQLSQVRAGQASAAPAGAQASGLGKSVPPGCRPAAGSSLNWEAEKRRILAALESESYASTSEAVAERLKIEEIIRTTDEALAEKDREIEQLQQLLQQQSSSLGDVAIGAAALEGILDQDAIVREERENLKRLQEECRGKLRQAEVEISMERAKLARKQVELEEKLRQMESREADAECRAEGGSQSGKPVRGRWLSRLGLSDPDAK